MIRSTRMHAIIVFTQTKPTAPGERSLEQLVDELESSLFTGTRFGAHHRVVSSEGAEFSQVMLHLQTPNSDPATKVTFDHRLLMLQEGTAHIASHKTMKTVGTRLVMKFVQPARLETTEQEIEWISKLIFSTELMCPNVTVSAEQDAHQVDGEVTIALDTVSDEAVDGFMAGFLRIEAAESWIQSRLTLDGATECFVPPRVQPQRG